MAIGTEVERLIVRLIGDGKNYERMLKEAENQTKTYTDKAGRLHDKLTGKFVSGQAVMSAALRRTGKAMVRAGASMRRLGRSLSLRVTAPLTIMAGVSVKAFADFDKAMTESTSIMEVTGKQIKQMRDLAISLSGEAAQGPAELAKSYFFLASAGLDAEAAMKALPQVAQFATAGAFDMALATDLLTDAQTAMGLSSKNAEDNLRGLIRVSDVFVKANQSANTSVQQVSEALVADAGTAARNMGQSLETTVAVLDAYASAGKKGAEAGNLFGRATRLLTKAQRANGEVFEKFGIRVIDKATGEYRNFIDIIADMEKAFKDLTKPQRDAALEQLGFAALAQKSITPLIGLSDAMRVYEETLIDAAGATRQVAGAQMESFSNQMSVLKNRVTAAAIEIGQSLAPLVRLLGNAVASAADAFRGWSPEVRLTVIVMTGLAAVAGPLLITLGFMSQAVGTLITTYAALGGAMSKASIAALGFKAALIGVTAIGITAFFAAARIELALLTAEANKSSDAFVRMADARLKALNKLRGAEFAAEGAKRLKDVQLARGQLREAESFQTKTTFKSDLKKVANFFGFDPAEPARQQLATAEAQLRKFQTTRAAPQPTTSPTAAQKPVVVTPPSDKGWPTEAEVKEAIKQIAINTAKEPQFVAITSGGLKE